MPRSSRDIAMDKTDWVLSDVAACRLKIEWDDEPAIGFAPHGYIRIWQSSCDEMDMIAFPIERLAEVMSKLVEIKSEFDKIHAKVGE